MAIPEKISFQLNKNTEKSRVILEKLSKQVSEKEAPKRPSLDKIYESAITGHEQTLTTEEKDFLELVKHIVFSHVNQYSSLVAGKFSKFTQSMMEHKDLLSSGILTKKKTPDHEDFIIIKPGDVISMDLTSNKTAAENAASNALSQDEEITVQIIKAHIKNEHANLLPLAINILNSDQAKIKVLDALFIEFKARFEDSERIPSAFDHILGEEFAKLTNWAMKAKVFNGREVNIANEAGNFTDELLERSNKDQVKLAKTLTDIIDGK